MPFVKRTIEPIRIGLNGGAVTECRNELQQVTAISLVDVMRQLSSLSMHVQDMFGELHKEAALIFERTFNLNQKVEYLRSEISQLNPIVEEVSLQDINLKKPFKFSSLKDQQIVTYSTRPYCISVVYATCEPPPSLQKLNSCRSDGKDSLKFYTDPGYFFELWCQAMQKESKSQMKKHKKNKKSTIISSKTTEDGQKWSTEKSQMKNKETNNSNKSQLADRQKQTRKQSHTQDGVIIDKVNNDKQKTVSLKTSDERAPVKIDVTNARLVKVSENTEKIAKKVEQCAKECQTQEEENVKLSTKQDLSKVKSEPVVSESSKQEYIPEQIKTLVSTSLKQTEKFESCSEVLDLSHKSQNLYENTNNLVSKDNMYENALAILNEYNCFTEEVIKATENRDNHGDESRIDKVVPEQSPVDLSLKTELDQINLNQFLPSSLTHEVSESMDTIITQHPECTAINTSSATIAKPSLSPLPASHYLMNKARTLNLPPAPPTPPELYEGVQFSSDICQLLDIQKKTSAINGDFQGGLSSEAEEDQIDNFVGGEKIVNDTEIDLSDLSDLPPIPSPPKFPPFMESSTVSSSSSFPSPPTPAYNQHHQSPQFNDIKESLIIADSISNNNNNILEPAAPSQQGDETSLTSELSAVSSESESSVINSNSLNNVSGENIAGVVRDTRCDLLAAIREGIQLRKVEECRQKIERKCKPTGRLDVQSIMEVAFEMRRKMLEEDDSDEDEDDFENNWSDED